MPLQKRDIGSFPVRLSGMEFYVLELLVTAGRELYGLEMVNTSNGKLSRGTVYVTLGRLKDKNFISSKVRRSRRGGLPNVLYQPTELGLKVYQWMKEMSDAVGQGRPTRKRTAARQEAEH